MRLPGYRGSRSRRGIAAALILVLGLLAAPLAPASAAEDPRSSVGLTKTNDTGGQPLKPGDAFIYTLSGQCSGLTVDCVDLTVTDTLPEGLEVTSLPKSTSIRDVTYDEATRKLTIVYKEPLQNPAGKTGVRAGQAASVEIGMRVPADTQLADGTVLTNSATVSADNADPVTDSTDVTVTIPRVVKPVATKTWQDGSAVAGSGEESTLTLGVRNNSSSSAQVGELTIGETNQQTFEYFDFVSANVTAFPAGADRARLVVTTADGTTRTGVPISSPGPLPLPAPVEPGQVVGFQIVFTNSNGDPLPYDPNGGSVDVELKLRDTTRSDDRPLRPTDKITVSNCATPSAKDPVAGAVNGTAACAPYDILPDTLVLTTDKKFFPDTNGDFTQQSGEHAVVGENSPVSGLVDVTNNSPFPVRNITVTEPAPGEPNDLDKVDVEKVRLRFPAGATGAKLTVTYADGTSTTTDYTSDTTVDVAKAGTTVTKVEVVYTGVDDSGNPTIQPGADAGLDIHGTLVDGVTAGALTNCARFTGDAGRTDGSGTATGHVCKDLVVENPNTSGGGDKSTDQTDIPVGQPIPMHLVITNNGNTPLVNPVLTDPPAKPDGTPDFAQGTPFAYLKIDSITLDPSSTPATIQVWDPTAGGGSGAWVAYDAADTALLDRATAIRVAYQGELPPEGRFTVNVVAERRPGTPDGVTFSNCFAITADGGYTGTPNCSASMSTGPAADSASLNKSISPGQLPRYVPGLPRQHADVGLTILNTGNMSAKFLEMTDRDEDFFDAVDLVSIKSNQMPAGADRVRIDAYVNGAWVDGTPSASAALPAGVNAADVTGIRATYSSTSTFNDGYTITPCAGNSCAGILHLDVSPRPALRGTGGPVPAHLEDTVGGRFLTKLEDPSRPAVIAPVTATLDLVKGSPGLAVSKTPDTVLAPGEDAPFYLKVANTGTADIPNLVVKDALPPGIAFLASFQGDNGMPYRIVDAQVPDGTPPVPAPVFTTTNDGSRISGLTWDFSKDAGGDAWVLAPGATFTIEIHVTLEAGINAGDVVTNTMGATSTDPDFACDGAAQDDGPFGPGRYCVDDATLTAKAGAAFTARKWVSGNDSLGWYNVLTGKTVAVGDTACLSAADGTGRRYTTAPCVALVNPGDRYHYLMRIQNAGTEAGTAMRIVDRLPVQGDKGVLLDQNRGTAWDKRPTLATPPVLTGPGTMSTAYENTEPLCTDDLNMGGAGSNAPQCPASTWNDAFGPDAAGLRLMLSFSPSLAPGGTVDVTYAMDTPLDVAHNGDPTIAWNSFAHNETTDRAGTPRVLQPNEPIQVGVALAYGSLKLVKAFGSVPDVLADGLRNVPFPFHVTCTIRPQGNPERTVLDADYRVTANKPVTIDGLPAGAVCKVWETAAHGGSADHTAADPAVVTIKAGLGAVAVETATVTNNFEFGALELVKKLDGEGAAFAADRAFRVRVSCALPDAAGKPTHHVLNRTYEVTAAEPVVIRPLPVNARCWAEEVDTGSAAEAVVDHGSADDPVVITAGDTGTITVTNTFPAAELVITKHVVNGGAGPYGFTLVCTTAYGAVPLPAADRAFALKDGESRTVAVPEGAVCTVTEQDVPDGDTVTYRASTGNTDGAVTVRGKASVDVTNTFVVPPSPRPDVKPDVKPDGTEPGGGLPITGAGGWYLLLSVVGGLALVGGTAALLIVRRRPDEV
ncbi:DUF5979 domain-containing protein [Yinghuangia sp. YIM S09857]|uniref:DUF5979 domain-containing protein n=1 Tax=Yinghuangia sp. YIM S09857 TaxID=3436929 RepID=UPI003F52B08A